MSKRAFVLIIASLILVVATMMSVQATVIPVDYNNMSMYFLFNNDTSIGENSTLVVDISGIDQINESDPETNLSQINNGHPSNNGIVKNTGTNVTYNQTGGYADSGAYSFLGIGAVGQNVIQVPYQSSQNFSAGITVIAWVKLYSNGTAQTIYARGNRAFALEIQANRVLGAFNTGLSDTGISSNNIVLNLSTWHRVAYTYNGAEICDYVDGVQDDCDPATGTITFESTFGSGIGNSVTGTARPLNGSVDDLIVYNYGLTSADVLRDYEAYVGSTECENDLNITTGCRIFVTNPTTWNALNKSLNGTVMIQSGVLNIINGTILNFSNSATISTRDTSYTSLNINDSTVMLQSGSTTSSFSFTRYLNLSIINSLIKNYNQMTFQGGNIGTIYMKNATLDDIVYLAFFGINSPSATVLDSSIKNSRGVYGGIRFKDTDNIIINNNRVENITGTNAYGIFSYSSDNNQQNISITNNIVNKTGGHCIGVKGTNNTIISNNYVTNCGGYGIDGYGTINHYIANNNVVVGSANGIVSSNGEGCIGCSSNISFNNNSITNTTCGFLGANHCGALVFAQNDNARATNTFINGTHGVGNRGLSIGTNTRNTYIENITMYDTDNDAVRIHVNAANVTIINFNSYDNGNNTFYLANSANITIKDSLVNTLEEHKGIITGQVLNLNLSNVAGKYLYTSNVSYLQFNLTTSKIYLKSTGSNSNNVTVSNLNHALIYFSDGRVSSQVSGSYDITLNNNEFCYVLDNFNLTEGNPRQYSPLWFSQSTSTEKHIASNLSDDVNVDVVISANCDTVGKITYTSDSGAFTRTYNHGDYVCTNNQITLSSLLIEPALNSNVITLSYNQAIQDICNDSGVTFSQSVALIGILLTIVLIGGVVSMIVLSFKGVIDLGNLSGKFNMEGILWGVLVVLITGLVLATVAFIVNGSVCPAYGA